MFARAGKRTSFLRRFFECAETAIGLFAPVLTDLWCTEDPLFATFLIVRFPSENGGDVGHPCTLSQSRGAIERLRD
jgi:hypothetical protein